jgi:hypothetical protein
MAASSLAGIFTAFASVLTACGLVVTALAGYRRSKTVEDKVDQVHKIVNQQHTDTMNYQRALIRALEDRGIKVPIDQSIPSEGK